MKVLGELEGVTEDKRTARFVAIIAIYDPATDRVRTCFGSYEGIIAKDPVGEGGFGYDPIFYNVELGKTNAEMTTEEKNAVSHRGKAVRAAREILEKEFL